MAFVSPSVLSLRRRETAGHFVIRFKNACSLLGRDVSSSLFVASQSQLRYASVRGRSHDFQPRVVRPSMNISTNDFRTGTTIEIDGLVYRVVEHLHVKPGKGSAFVRTKLKNMKTGNTIDKTFRAGEMVDSAQLDKIVMQHTYRDGADYVFMNMETFEEERLSKEALGSRAATYMVEGLEVEVLKHNDDVLGVDIPKTLTVTVVETDPGVKGNTVQGGTKPAKLESGATVQVPLFINSGERINVNTEENKYVSRSNE